MSVSIRIPRAPCSQHGQAPGADQGRAQGHSCRCGKASPVPAEAGACHVLHRVRSCQPAPCSSVPCSASLYEIHVTDRALLNCCCTSFIPKVIYFMKKKKKSQNALSEGNKPAPIFILFLFSITSLCLAFLSASLCISASSSSCFAAMYLPLEVFPVCRVWSKGQISHKGRLIQRYLLRSSSWV